MFKSLFRFFNWGKPGKASIGIDVNTSVGAAISTQFTKKQYDRILQLHTEYRVGNKCSNVHKPRFSNLNDLTEHLNIEFGVLRTRSAYARVWNRKISREQCL